MAIEKVNSFVSNVRFGQAESVKDNQIHKTEEDKEKSSSMSKMVGLGALAAITIGGIIYFAKRGKAPSKASSGTSVGESVTSAASSTSSSSSAVGGGSTPPKFEQFKKFMKKLEDGTEYLSRTEERDKDGHLVKSVCYSPSGKVERVREFKMAPAGVTTPARNVVVSEIRYDKDGKIIYKRTENPDFSGYVVEKIPKDNPSVLETYFVDEKFDGHRFRAEELSCRAVNRETGRRVYEMIFCPTGEYDGLRRDYDRKTGIRVVSEGGYIGDSVRRIDFGEGKSKRISIFRLVGDDKRRVLQQEIYDYKGRLRYLYTSTQGGRFTRIENPAKGRATIVEEENGVKRITKTYKKNGVTYTQKFFKDEANPENTRIEVYRGAPLFLEERIKEIIVKSKIK